MIRRPPPGSPNLRCAPLVPLVRIAIGNPTPLPLRSPFAWVSEFAAKLCVAVVAS